MTRTTPAPSSTIDELNRLFLSQLTRLQKAITAARQTPAIEAWHETCRVVDSLPLATDQYDRARSRLSNCRRYLISGEYGAASYELKLLVGTHRQHNHPDAETNRSSREQLEPVVFEPVDEFAISR